jgi:phage tail tape-measure protein
MFNRTVAIAALCVVMSLFSGCSASSTSAFMADNMPKWMGGLPKDAPPRPSDPRYPEYEREQRAKAEAVKIAPPNPDAVK